MPRISNPLPRASLGTLFCMLRRQQTCRNRAAEYVWNINARSQGCERVTFLQILCNILSAISQNVTRTVQTQGELNLMWCFCGVCLAGFIPEVIYKISGVFVTIRRFKWVSDAVSTSNTCCMSNLWCINPNSSLCTHIHRKAERHSNAFHFMPCLCCVFACVLR